MTPDEVRRIRLSLGLSQTAFAEALGLGRKTIARYEGNGSKPTPNIAKLLWVIDRHPEVLGYFMEQR